MSYKKALEAAGATVHAYKEFGSYQGDWWAKVTYNGKTGWISDYYGSCTSCDAFEHEFGWNYGEEDTPKYQERLVKFGQGYLDNIISHGEAKKKASEHISWDVEADEMLKFINRNGE